MDLRKTNENVTRTFDAEGNAQERVDSISYEVRDSDGNPIGSAHVNSYDASLSISFNGHDSAESGEARLRQLLGID